MNQIMSPAPVVNAVIAPAVAADDSSGDEEPARRRPKFHWGEEGDATVGFIIGVDGKYRLVCEPGAPPYSARVSHNISTPNIGDGAPCSRHDNLGDVP